MISQIYGFTYVLFIAASALYITFFDLHDMSSFTLNTFPLKFADGLSVICLHTLHQVHCILELCNPPLVYW